MYIDNGIQRFVYVAGLHVEGEGIGRCRFLHLRVPIKGRRGTDRKEIARKGADRGNYLAFVVNDHDIINENRKLNSDGDPGRDLKCSE